MELKRQAEQVRQVRTHCHRHALQADDASVKLQAKNKLVIASGVCLVFMIGEVIGGYLAHSLAIMTDAAHLLTDFGSMMVSLFSLWISSRPPTKTVTFGWHRSEILGAFISVVSIWVVTGALVYLAIERIVRNDYDINGHVMLVTSGCAVIVNIVMAYILHHSTSFHAHGSGYHQIDENGQSPAPAHTGHAPRCWEPEYKVADPICTFLFSAFVLCTTVTILKDVFRILMEGCPKEIQFKSVKEVLLSVSSVKSVHSLHLWGLSVNHNLVSVHLAIDEGADHQSVLNEATDLLHHKFGFSSSTVQVETFSEDMSLCSDCQDPQD
ncbi:hypothetical protein WMY93_030954 [Mugilogobius chulae]|uniref:Probable proton-coupled zinc antiporter SLC30A3 n=1 Tax=Mugilogobius chulae TaxID=88201 RepID=A0AAW0MG50_9GOBI